MRNEKPERYDNPVKIFIFHSFEGKIKAAILKTAA